MTPVSAEEHTEVVRQLDAYRRFVNKIDDRIEYARKELKREELYAMIDQLTGELTDPTTITGIKSAPDPAQMHPVGKVIEGFTDAMGGAAHVVQWKDKPLPIGAIVYGKKS